MLYELRASFGLFVFFLLVTGLIYPFAVMGIGKAVFPVQAEGSLIRVDGHVIGSELIGQNFTSDGYFHPRPSAAGLGYNAAASSGSNLGPTSAELMAAVHERVANLKKSKNAAPIPVDYVTASASGLDPDISLEAARYQIGRIAEFRHIAPTELEELIKQQASPPGFGFLGENRVNVLTLNRALDHLPGTSAP